LISRYIILITKHTMCTNIDIFLLNGTDNFVHLSLFVLEPFVGGKYELQRRSMSDLREQIMYNCIRYDVIYHYMTGHDII